MNKLQRLAEMQTQIDALKAEIERESKVKVWVPSGSYLLTGDGFTDKSLNPSDVINYSRNGNARKTFILAKRELQRRLPGNIISAYVDEFAPDYVPNWSYESLENVKYYIYYDYNYATYKKACHSTTEIVGITYMPEHIAEEILAKIKSGEIKL